jgi:hypothetical protein
LWAAAIAPFLNPERKPDMATNRDADRLRHSAERHHRPAKAKPPAKAEQMVRGKADREAGDADNGLTSPPHAKARPPAGYGEQRSSKAGT